MLTSLCRCDVCVSGQGTVVGFFVLEEASPDSVGQAGGAITLSNLFQEFLFIFLVKDNLHITEISFLSVTSSLCVIPDVEVPSGLTNQTPMNPQSHGIKTSLLGVVKQVPECPDHEFGDFLMTVHEDINGIDDVESLYGMHGVFGPKIIGVDTF